MFVAAARRPSRLVSAGCESLKPRSGEAGINSGIFYAWGRTVTMWLKLKGSRLAEFATAVFEGEDQAIDLSAIMGMA